MPFLYLTTKGWKSGRDHEIEIWYVELDGRYYIVSEGREKSHWVQNIKHNPVISVRVGKESFEGRGRIVTEQDLISKAKDMMNQAYKWSDGLVVELARVA